MFCAELAASPRGAISAKENTRQRKETCAKNTERREMVDGSRSGVYIYPCLGFPFTPKRDIKPLQEALFPSVCWLDP